MPARPGVMTRSTSKSPLREGLPHRYPRSRARHSTGRSRSPVRAVLHDAGERHRAGTGDREAAAGVAGRRDCAEGSPRPRDCCRGDGPARPDVKAARHQCAAKRSHPDDDQAAVRVVGSRNYVKGPPLGNAATTASQPRRSRVIGCNRAQGDEHTAGVGRTTRTRTTAGTVRQDERHGISGALR